MSQGACWREPGTSPAPRNTSCNTINIYTKTNPLAIPTHSLIYTEIGIINIKTSIPQILSSTQLETNVNYYRVLYEWDCVVHRMSLTSLLLLFLQGLDEPWMHAGEHLEQALDRGVAGDAPAAG